MKIEDSKRKTMEEAVRIMEKGREEEGLWGKHKKITPEEETSKENTEANKFMPMITSAGLIPMIVRAYQTGHIASTVWAEQQEGRTKQYESGEDKTGKDTFEDKIATTVENKTDKVSTDNTTEHSLNGRDQNDPDTIHSIKDRKENEKEEEADKKKAEDKHLD